MSDAPTQAITEKHAMPQLLQVPLAASQRLSREREASLEEPLLGALSSCPRDPRSGVGRREEGSPSRLTSQAGGSGWEGRQ